MLVILEIEGHHAVGAQSLRVDGEKLRVQQGLRNTPLEKDKMKLARLLKKRYYEKI